jgi:predicted alpha/beta superfamily hydrolase
MRETQHNAVNVTVINEAFEIPQLGRTRRVWIYKPADHDDSNKSYPVVYMQDGQNLFDEGTAFGEEWGIDETLNALEADCIVVGIDNDEHRMTEYNFHDNEEYGSGEGKQYIEFIVETLKPYIDKHYKTKPEREHTQIAGSSMGGLISLYGAMHFPETFGGAGIFSPSLWLVPDSPEELQKLAELNLDLPQRFYFYGGAQEGGDMLTHINNMAKMLHQFPLYTVDLHVDPLGDHSEYRWRNMFQSYYAWLSQGLPSTF